MKKHVMIPTKVFKSLLFLALIFSFVNISAQTEKTRTIEKTFSGKTALWASHRYGDIIMKKGSGNQIKAILKLKASGNDTNELEKFLNEFELNASESADNKVDIQTGNYIESWNTVKVIATVKSTIKLKNGKTYNGISKFDMTLELYVPKLRYATLENKYNKIRVEEGTSDILLINLYDGELEAPGTYSKLNMDMKYSEAEVGNFTSSESKLYDCDIVMGNGQSLTLESKYSEIKAGSVQNITLDSYDDKFTFADAKENVKIKDKYSEFTFNGEVGDIMLDLYDSQVVAGNAGNIKIAGSKYTEYTFQDTKSIEINSSYDDAIKVAKTASLSVNESKYTEYEIGSLSKVLKIKSYDDEIRVRNVGGEFEEFTFDGKYTDVTLPIPSSVKYEIEAYLKYGKLYFPEKELEAGVYKEKNSEVNIQGKLKGAGGNAPKVKINSYDGTIRLN